VPDAFSAEVTQDGGATVIHIRGDIDIATAGRLRDVIEPHLGPEQTIVLDFSEVTFCDTACLTLLVQARGRLTADGGSLVLRNPSAFPRRLLTMAKAQGLIDIDIEDHPPKSN
jgi:anti-anti-sigma factor